MSEERKDDLLQSTALTSQSTTDIDGFADYDDCVEGEDNQFRPNIPIVKFTNFAKWVLRGSEEELPPSKEYIVTAVDRLHVKWFGASNPPEVKVLAPGEKFPNTKKLNEEAPIEEWVPGYNGELKGPYENQHQLCLLDPETLDRFRYPTGTAGGHIAVRDLVERTKWVRKFRGEDVYPVVRLRKATFPTRYDKQRQRPHFEVARWVSLGGEGGMTALPPTPPLALPPKSVKEAQDHFAGNQTKTEEQPSGVRVVEPPSLGEEIGDKIPF